MQPKLDVAAQSVVGEWHLETGVWRQYADCGKISDSPYYVVWLTVFVPQERPCLLATRATRAPVHAFCVLVCDGII